jgi:hypothetical protein
LKGLLRNTFKKSLVLVLSTNGYNWRLSNSRNVMLENLFLSLL